MMSETTPTYIPCASGNQLMTEVLVRLHGSLVEIAGRSIMHFTPSDARRLALTILRMANAIEPEAGV